MKKPEVRELHQADLNLMLSTTIIHMLVCIPREHTTTLELLEAVITGTLMTVVKPGKEEALIDGLAAEVKRKMIDFNTLLAMAGVDKDKTQ